MPSCAKPRRRSRRSASPPTALPPASPSMSTSSAGSQGTAQGADDAVLQVALAARGEAVTRLLDEMLAPVAGPRGRVIEAMRYSARSEENTSELQSLMRSSYTDFCL